MKSILPLWVALALVGAGCSLPGSTPAPKNPAMKVNKPISYTTPASKVQVMTKAFSLSQNPTLHEATRQLSTLSQTFAGVAASVNTAGYRPQSLVSDLRVSGMRAAYQVAGVFEQGPTTFLYDDETREITGITGPDAEVRFAFSGAGQAERTWKATIVKSKDGTTGTYEMTVSGTWRAMPTPLAQAAAPMPAPAPFDEQGAPAPMPTFQPPSPPPFKFLQNEYPETVEKVSFRLALTPQGDAEKAVELTGAFDEPGEVPQNRMRLPLHWKLFVAVKALKLDWESRLSLAQGQSRFEGGGELLAAVEGGEERFDFDFRINEAERQGGLNLTNVGAKVRLEVKARQEAASRQPAVTSTLVSTVDGSTLGTVAPDPARPRFAVVTLQDGSKVDWELYPADLVLPGLTPPPAMR